MGEYFMSQEQLSLQQNSNTASSSLDANQLALLQQATSSYSSLQLAWASGYLAAKSENGTVATLPAATQAQAASTLTILFVKIVYNVSIS